MLKKVLIAAAIVLGVLLLLLAGLVIFLSITEYKPADREKVACQVPAAGLTPLSVGDSITVYTWNIGYAGLGKESDFFMDGGKMVDPPSQATVKKNLSGIQSFLENQDADIWLLQEVDVNSSRTDHLDEHTILAEALHSASAFAYNYKCPFVPIPLPPMGQIESGIATFSTLETSESAERISLPCPFSWPVRIAQIKRCLLVTRTPIAGTDKELVLVNLHLEAYDDGEGKIAQTKRLMKVLQEEYAKGNYVIAGGDFNQSFPGALEQYPITDTEKWTPGVLESASLPEGWQFAFDAAAATCRLLDQPYCDDCQLYVIDGFILSPNVTLNSVRTEDLSFEFSDHNPVRLEVTLNP